MDRPQFLVRHQQLSAGLVTAYICVPTFVFPATALPENLPHFSADICWLVRAHAPTMPGDHHLLHQDSL